MSPSSQLELEIGVCDRGSDCVRHDGETVRRVDRQPLVQRPQRCTSRVGVVIPRSERCRPLGPYLHPQPDFFVLNVVRDSKLPVGLVAATATLSTILRRVRRNEIKREDLGDPGQIGCVARDEGRANLTA